MTAFESPRAGPGQPPAGVLRRLRGARLPVWLHRPAPGSPMPALHDVHFDAAGQVRRVVAHDPDAERADGDWLLNGAPVLPAVIEAHAHLDKAYTVHRAPPAGPGLLAQIEATRRDSMLNWSEADLRQRAGRGLNEALAAGARVLRTHVNWDDADTPPAWPIYEELRQEWHGRVALEMVNLTPLPVYADPAVAERIAHAVSRSDGGVLGAFVHTTNHDDAALETMLEAAARHGLRVDLHIDEELSPDARGVASAARIAAKLPLAGRVALSHACALAVQPADVAKQTLDAVANAGLAFISLPSTNLLLQDAETGRTPRLRGITLVHEARSRGIPVLLGSDNVQDAFNPVGHHDPVGALELGVLAAHVGDAFDAGSLLICDASAIGIGPQPSTLEGAAGDLVVFAGSDPSARAWPADSTHRIVLRAGRIVAGS